MKKDKKGYEKTYHVVASAISSMFLGGIIMLPFYIVYGINVDTSSTHAILGLIYFVRLQIGAMLNDNNK